MHTLGEEALFDLEEAYAGCELCGLCKSRKNIVFGGGSPTAPILVVGDRPGPEEDHYQEPFVGDGGRLLMSVLAAAMPGNPEIEAIDQLEEYDYWVALREYLDAFVYWTNLVMCRPPEDREPKKPEIMACADRLHRTIYAIDPKIIVALGKNAAEILLGSKVRLGTEEGRIFDVSIPSPVTGNPVRYPMMPLVSPGFLLSKADLHQVPQKEGSTYNTIQAASGLFRILDQYADRTGFAYLPELVDEKED